MNTSSKRRQVNVSHSFSAENYSESFTSGLQIKTDQWTESTAGGCLNNLDSYSHNPVYRLEMEGPKDEENQLLIKLKGPK
jgi:hypothetical protein